MTNNFAYYHLLELMSGLHDCHVCKYPIEQISGKGRKRTYCDKYKMPISKVRNNCIDRFGGFTVKELTDITKQYRQGRAEFHLPDRTVA